MYPVILFFLFLAVSLNGKADTEKKHKPMIFCFGEKSALKISSPEILAGVKNISFEVRIGVKDSEKGFWVLGTLQAKDSVSLEQLIDQGDLSFETFNSHKAVEEAKAIEIQFLTSSEKVQPKETVLNLNVSFPNRGTLVDQLTCEHFYGVESQSTFLVGGED